MWSCCSATAVRECGGGGNWKVTLHVYTGKAKLCISQSGKTRFRQC